jgi:zinc D-Ala-D-Ala carboxypeptidase
MGDLSEHFSTSEFRCKGEGRPGHTDHPVVVSRRLVEALERLRALADHRPLVIVSGHRCRPQNRRVGGAPRSKHVSGEAADLEPGYATVAQAVAAGFRGIGSSGPWATHVDVRAGLARWRY